MIALHVLDDPFRVCGYKQDLDLFKVFDIGEDIGRSFFRFLPGHPSLAKPMIAHDAQSLSARLRRELSVLLVFYRDLTSTARAGGVEDASLENLFLLTGLPFPEDMQEVVKYFPHILKTLESRVKSRLVRPEALTSFTERLAQVASLLGGLNIRGLFVDHAELERLKAELTNDRQKIEQMVAEAGELFGVPKLKLSSRKAMVELLYGKMGFPVLARTGKGEPSVAAEVLEQLLEHVRDTIPPAHRILLQKIVEGRRVDHVIRTLDSVKKLSSGKGVVFPTWRTVSADGVLTAYAVNPSVTSMPREALRVFKAPRGYKWVSADYVQAEITMLALLAMTAGISGPFVDLVLSGQDFYEELGKVFSPQRPLPRGEVKRAVMNSIFYPSALTWDERVRREVRLKIKEVYGDFDEVLNLFVSHARASDKSYPSLDGYMRILSPEVGDLRFEASAIHTPTQNSVAACVNESVLSVAQKAVFEQHLEVMAIFPYRDKLVLMVPETVTLEEAPDLLPVITDPAQVYEMSDSPPFSDVELKVVWREGERLNEVV